MLWERSERSGRIARELLALGVRPGGVLLVHSSLRALGPAADPETVIQGLLQALGSAGTLLMPALSYERVTADSPVFDLLDTPSNVGVVPEQFRRRTGTKRSLHPTHSVCGLGRHAGEILSRHYLDRTPCGDNSPFHLLPEMDGQILMLGCGLRPNTSMHAIEEMIMPPYLFGQPLTYRLRAANGREQEALYRRHGFTGWIQRYDRVESLLDEPDLNRGIILEAEAHLMEAPGLWQAALLTLRQDPLYFVEKASE